jgi:hypothetical protein
MTNYENNRFRWHLQKKIIETNKVNLNYYNNHKVMIKAYKFSTETLKERKHAWDRGGRQINNNMDSGWKECEDVDCIEMLPDRMQRQVFVNTVMDLDSTKVCKVFTSWAPNSQKLILHAVRWWASSLVGLASYSWAS